MYLEVQEELINLLERYKCLNLPHELYRNRVDVTS